METGFPPHPPQISLLICVEQSLLRLEWLDRLVGKRNLGTELLGEPILVELPADYPPLLGWLADV